MAEDNGRAEAILVPEIKTKADFATKDLGEFLEQVTRAYKCAEQVPGFKRLTIRGEATKQDSYGDGRERWKYESSFWVYIGPRTKKTPYYKVALIYDDIIHNHTEEGELDVPEYVNEQLLDLGDCLVSRIESVEFTLEDKVLVISRKAAGSKKTDQTGQLFELDPTEKIESTESVEQTD